MPYNTSLSQAVLMALTLLGLRATSSQHFSHLSMRQLPAGPANLLPQVLARHGDLSKYTSLMKVCETMPDMYQNPA